ncbi:MAG: leucine-rich repeat protein [Firmicutes bacterium]|nr:leucine-rich repeat protein [Bacillota bacterium]
MNKKLLFTSFIILFVLFVVGGYFFSIYLSTNSKHTIYFEENGGSIVLDITLQIGTVIEPPSDPTKTGFSFGGWYFDSGLTIVYTFTIMPAEDTTLYAKWNEILPEDDPSDYTYLLLANDTYEITGYIGSNTTLIIPSDYLGKTITSIGSFAFYECTSLISVTISSNIINIDYSAFYNCSSLESVTISIGVLFIGQNAFANCSSLTEISIPSSVTSIEMDSFLNTSSLMSITVEDGNQNYSSENGILFNKQKTILIVYPIGKTETNFVILSTVTSLGTSAFANCTSLTNIEIPSTLTSIEPAAFFNCSNLMSLTVDDENQNYSSENGILFNKQKNILIVYPKGKIDTSYLIPYSVTTIGPNAFENCNSLTTITIPTSVTNIDSVAFWNNDSLLNLIVDSENQYYSSEEGVLFNKDKTILIMYPKGKTETSYLIPLSVTSIGSNAFANCENLTSITIPSNVTTIGDVAFYSCIGITSIMIPESVISMGFYIFEYCDDLVIYAEATSKPSGWDSAWNSHNLFVVWGYES